MANPKKDNLSVFSDEMTPQLRTKIRFSWKGVFLSFVPPAVGVIMMLIGFYLDVVMFIFIGGITALGGFVAMFAMGIYIFALQSLPEDVYRRSLQSSIEYSELVKKLAEERKKKNAEALNEKKDDPSNQQP